MGRPYGLQNSRLTQVGRSRCLHGLEALHAGTHAQRLARVVGVGPVEHRDVLEVVRPDGETSRAGASAKVAARAGRASVFSAASRTLASPAPLPAFGGAEVISRARVLTHDRCCEQRAGRCCLSQTRAWRRCRRHWRRRPSSSRSCPARRTRTSP